MIKKMDCGLNSASTVLAMARLTLATINTAIDFILPL